MNDKELNVLILYDPRTTFTNTLWEHLLSFKKYLGHRIFYSNGCSQVNYRGTLSEFDVVIIHYSVRIAYNMLSPQLDKVLQQFWGLKVLFVQDEYDQTENTRITIERLGINVVFTNVPGDYIETVYPHNRFPNTKFVSNLTGYVPMEFDKRISWRPLKERKYLIAYRGRALPYWYGNLGQEKMLIGKRMLAECKKRNLPVDIQWEDYKRIYGSEWYDFLSNTRATLATESGSNVFDDFGNIKSEIESYLSKHPHAPYSTIYDKFLSQYEGKVKMNQVSPKIFEAISLGTALILFEGDYSHVVKPNEHYISLKKDFSNIEDVLRKLQDDQYIQGITEQAYKDIIASGRYSYKTFMKSLSNIMLEEYHKKIENLDTKLTFKNSHHLTYEMKTISQQIKTPSMTFLLIPQRKMHFPLYWVLLNKYINTALKLLPGRVSEKILQFVQPIKKIILRSL